MTTGKSSANDIESNSKTILTKTIPNIMQDYSNYITDEQRIAIASKRNGTAPDWYIVDEWAEQAKTSSAKDILRNIAIRLFHLEEYATYGEL